MLANTVLPFLKYVYNMRNSKLNAHQKSNHASVAYSQAVNASQPQKFKLGLFAFFKKRINGSVRIKGNENDAISSLENSV